MRTRHRTRTLGSGRSWGALMLALLSGAAGCAPGGGAPGEAPGVPEARALVAPSVLPNLAPDLAAAPSGKRPSPALPPLHDEADVHAMLSKLPPAILAKLIDDAGGLDRIVRYFLNLGNVLPLQSRTPVAGGGGIDILGFLRGSGRIVTFPGLNTPADEVLGYPQTFNRYIVYYTNAACQFDIRRYDLETQLIDTMPALNTPADELYPTASLGGHRMAFVVLTPAGRRLRLYDDRTHNVYIPGVEQFARRDCLTPRITPLGDKVAFSSPGVGRLDIFVYDIERAIDATPPFVNSPADELQPAYSLDETRMLFVSNRRGNLDIYLADMVSGIVEPLVLANSDATDVYPVWLFNDEILFYSNRTGRFRFYVYHLTNHTLDLMPPQFWLPEGPDLIPADLPSPPLP